MKKAITTIIICSFLAIGAVSCRGPITGHDYSKEEIIQILKFLGVSAERINKYRKGEITLDDIHISKERLEKAKKYIEQLEKERKANKDK